MFDFFFFFNDTATTEIYTLALHDALPISREHLVQGVTDEQDVDAARIEQAREQRIVARECDDPLTRSEDHTSELESPCNLVCRLLLEKKKKKPKTRQ